MTRLRKDTKRMIKLLAKVLVKRSKLPYFTQDMCYRIIRIAVVTTLGGGRKKSSK